MAKTPNAEIFQRGALLAMLLDVSKSASKLTTKSQALISVEVRFKTVSENVRLPSNFGGVLGAVVGVLAGVSPFAEKHGSSSQDLESSTSSGVKAKKHSKPPPRKCALLSARQNLGPLLKV